MVVISEKAPSSEAFIFFGGRPKHLIAVSGYPFELNFARISAFF